MSELKLPRLLAAAKEFNIGQDTLVEFLVNKGFSRDDLKPTAKLAEDMYRALQQEFQSDKVAKTKADLIEIPKGAAAERKKKDEEEIIFRKEREELKVEKQPEPVAEALIPPAPLVVEVLPMPIPETLVEEEPEMVKIEIPEIEGLKTVGKIDLSAIDSSTRPKKVVKKKQEETEPQIIEEAETPVVEEITKIVEVYC